MIKKFRNLSTPKKVTLVAGIAAAVAVIVTLWKYFTPIDEDEEDCECCCKEN